MGNTDLRKSTKLDGDLIKRMSELSTYLDRFFVDRIPRCVEFFEDGEGTRIEISRRIWTGLRCVDYSIQIIRSKKEKQDAQMCPSCPALTWCKIRSCAMERMETKEKGD